MKRFLISGLTLVLSVFAISSIAYAKQATLSDAAADLNSDGIVTLTELEFYNRDQRNN